ncbi:PR domain zinc finger protein 15-like isoform X2 [Thrips palmi]|uniref:PR domain zinc finger protein 15-like isoform X2 n=1 Tax=Thrips palmi TaxID=161013 RepID=A0A6P8ZTU1_THRPL|nr:PR domain zinc finger protein 15-like isoform X2 [Thrips palmi]
MSSSWKNWCRLCANLNSGVSILSDGTNHGLSEKIKKYLSISVLEEDKTSHFLCTKCYDHLAVFDKFVNNCLQVQTMFSVLSELVDEDIDEQRVHEIRREFISPDLDPLNGPTNQLTKSSSLEERNHLGDKIKETGNCKKKISPPNSKTCEERIGHLTENNSIGIRKSSRIKAMAEIKQAFTEDEILGDTLDSDFNEDSFENLLDSDDSYQPDNDFKTDNKLSQNLFNNSDSKQAHLLESNKVERDDRLCESKNLVNTSMIKIQDDLKLQENISNNEINSCLLPSDMNSLSDTDLSDFICEDDDDEDPLDNIENGNNNDNKGYRLNGSWKNETKCKTGETDKLSTQQQHEKIYELSEMFEDPDDPESDNWNKISNGKVEEKRNSKSKEPYKCEQCNKFFLRKALLNAHMTSHVPKDQQPFVCCKCARRFHCEALLRNHERVHLPNEEKLVYPCDICKKKFSSKSAVTAHLKAIHYGERPFICHLCGHSFSSKGVLQEHLTIHSDEEPWHCTKCTKKFKTKYRLKIHMDTHRDTPYSCPHCPLQLSTRRTLRMHLVVHRDTKAYQCATCGKAFRRAKDLKNHNNLHTGRRPYTCPFCSRTFANGSNCRSHKRRMHPEELRMYEAALAGNGHVEMITNSTPLETEATTTDPLIPHQDIDEEGNQSMKEDSQDSLLTEMALDLQQPQMLTDKSGLTSVHENPVVTAADLTLAPLVTLSSTLPKLEPDDSRLVMNLTTQMHDAHDSMEAMSPLNLNIMSPMNLNISSPLNLNISSPLNLNISSVLHSPTGRNQQQHSVQSQHPQNPSRYQQVHHHVPQQQHTHLTLQPAQHQNLQQLQHHHQQINQQPQVHQQMHQQQVPRSSSLQLTTLQTPLNPPSTVHTLTSQTQLPAHLNNTVHHVQQIQTFVPLNQQGTMYNHHNVQDSVSSAAIVAAAAVAHSMTSSTTTLPPFSSNPYVQQPMSYGRGGHM